MKLKKAEKQEINYFEIAKELYMVNLQKKALDKKEKELKEKIALVLQKQPTDSKHNAYLAFKTVEGKDAYVKYEARQSVTLNESLAKDFFTSKKLLDTVYKSSTSYYFDENEIQLLVANNTISFDELEKITEKKINYAIKFVNKKEEDEDTQSK